MSKIDIEHKDLVELTKDWWEKYIIKRMIKKEKRWRRKNQ